jgi:hypothetical protein
MDDRPKETLSGLSEDSQKWKVSVSFPHIISDPTLYSLLVQTAKAELYPRIYEK